MLTEPYVWIADVGTNTLPGKVGPFSKGIRAVIDTRTRKVVSRIPTSEKLIEIDFDAGRPVAAGRR